MLQVSRKLHFPHAFVAYISSLRSEHVFVSKGDDLQLIEEGTLWADSGRWPPSSEKC